ncbi:uncharacterized protein LOC136029025 [Artemia franciscana]|uniref:Uncharacterized protein n=1 Tax=Artemia franciscana TaxID=6661 RepID=A0AA88HNE5_ARTSF|nr:hypothetical protein QYM36_015678 [Artemia franciscana]KAK2708067.1 hypothetical protein QYM36_015678 [Artemia franciscana]
MKSSYFAILSCLFLQANTQEEEPHRYPEPRGLLYRNKQNYLFASETPSKKFSDDVVDPQVQVEQNITFHEIGCVVGRSCSHIIHPNLPKSSKPTFKPYIKNDRNHFKGTLSMLYPPGKTSSDYSHLQGNVKPFEDTTSTTTVAPRTTTNNFWVVRPNRNPPSSYNKDDKKAIVINSFLTLLKELAAAPSNQNFSQELGSANYKTQSSINKVSTTSKPSSSLLEQKSEIKESVSIKPSLGGVALYKKPPKNLFYQPKRARPTSPRPILFSNNMPVYNAPNVKVASTTQKPQYPSINQGSWLHSLLQAKPVNDNIFSRYPFNSKIRNKPLSNPIESSWEKRPSYYPFSTKKVNKPLSSWEKTPVSTFSFISDHSDNKLDKQSAPQNKSKIRPFIITAEEVRRKKEEEEKQAAELRKKPQMLKPFIVSTSFGFNPKSGRALDTNAGVSSNLTVLPSRGKTIIQNIGGHLIETSADQRNLTTLIMRDKTSGARRMRANTENRHYFNKYTIPQRDPENLTLTADQRNLTALIMMKESIVGPRSTRANTENPNYFHKYIVPQRELNNPETNLTALIYSQDLPGTKSRHFIRNNRYIGNF